jgi:hypothetical protein
MKPVDSTIAILAFKVLNKYVNEAWIDWAVEMLVAGYETEHLAILASESAPFNQFEMQELTNKVLQELHLDYSDPQTVIKDYACYLIEQLLSGAIEMQTLLKMFKEFYYDYDYEVFRDFAFLYFAKDDLLYGETQQYWDGATRENIDAIVFDYFSKWKANQCK